MTGGKPLKTGKVRYNIDMAEALFDSVVVVGPYEVLISTKAKGKGADASIKGLYDTMVDKKEEFPPSFWRKAKNKKFQRIISIIMQKSAEQGLLDVAELEGVIDDVDKAAILQGKAAERSRSGRFKPTPTLSKYMKEYVANTEHEHYQGYLHAIAAVAKQLTTKLNEEDYTEVAKEVLNHANVVQMYFSASPKGEDLICKGYKLVWPPNFEGRIDFRSGKNFSATTIKGKIGFRIVPTGAPKTDSDIVDDTMATASADAEKARKAAQRAKDKAVGRIIEPGKRDVRDPRVKDLAALGREKKK